MSDLTTINELMLRDISVSQCSFRVSEMEAIKVYYISDIHLLHHINIHDNVKKQINAIVKNLFNGELEYDILSNALNKIIILFGGDTSSKTEITTYFYHAFQQRYSYFIYKRWRKRNHFAPPMTEEQAKNTFHQSLSELTLLYEKKKLQLCQWGIDYDQIEKDLLHNNLLDYISANNLPSFIEFRIKELRKIHSEIFYLNIDKEKIIKNLILGNNFKKPSFFSIFVVLGNHELADFCTVNDAVNYYEDFFRKEHIRFLHNNGYRYNDFDIIGGIGFAKFNERHNASNLVTTTPAMSRECEISESEKFLSFYKQTVAENKKEMKHLVVLSHYPLNDWLNQEGDSICTYFTGHSHHDNSVHTQSINVYADNQIGYKQKAIQFQSCCLGTIYNPFIDYGDGYYEITTKQYRQFYYYSGELIQGTGNIDRELTFGNAHFYMIKQNSFYGFFIISKTKTKICVGGRTKKVSSVKDIHYFYDFFKIMLSQYVSLLLPYRQIQNRVSSEVKRFGFSGKIHGLIVDIDFYYHIMINPIDGKITFYYSPFMGKMRAFDSLGSLLADIEKNEIESGDCTKMEIYETMVKENCLITRSTEAIQEYIGKMITVDIKNSIYALSNRVNQLQRLFTANILRDWNDQWAQSCLDRTSQFLRKTYRTTMKSDEEADLELDIRFDELVDVVPQKDNFELWETKKQITREMMYSVCRKYIKAHMTHLKEVGTVNFCYYVTKTLDYVCVNCAPDDILEFYKILLTQKMQYAKPIVLYAEQRNNKVTINICLVGSSDILLYCGKYLYQNKKLVKQQ